MPHYEYRVIPAETEVGGDDLYLGTPTGDAGALLPIELPEQADTGVETLNAMPVFVHPDGGARYAFAAWNVRSDDPNFQAYAVDDLQVAFSAAPAVTAPVTATAWYVPLGGDGPPRVRCYGLDRQVNRFFRKTPIAATAPPGAWAGGASREVATETEVEVTAGPRMNGQVLIDKLYAYVATEADFTTWRMRGRAGAAGPLPLGRGAGGVAVAIYEARVVGRNIPTLDYELFRLLTGHLDLDALRRVLTTPASDPPSWRSLDLARTTRTLAGLARPAVEQIRDRVRELRDRADLAGQIAERVLRG